MKPPKSWVAVIAFGGLFSFAVSSSAAPAGRTNPRGGKAAEHMSSQGTRNTNAQWSADPEKGWVRSDERNQQHDKEHPTNEVQRGNDKAKGKGKKS
jgi:hypothetical protein